jgi:hypothetical protein
LRILNCWKSFGKRSKKDEETLFKERFDEIDSMRENVGPGDSTERSRPAMVKYRSISKETS